MTSTLCIASPRGNTQTCRVDAGNIAALFAGSEEAADPPEITATLVARGFAAWRTGRARATDLVRLLQREAEARRGQRQRPVGSVSAC